MQVRYAAITFALALLVQITSTSFCENLQQVYSPTKRYVSQHGILKNISLYWDSEPARASASLLAVILQHVLGYQSVQLLEAKDNLRDLKAEVPCDVYRPYEKVTLALLSSWVTGTNSLMSPGLKKLRTTTNITYRRVHMHLAKQYRQKEQCRNITQWSFYNDITTLKDCGFTNNNTRGDPIMNMYQIDSSNEVLTLFNGSSLQLKSKKLNRTMLSQMLRTDNVSLLFVDYGIWEPHVSDLSITLCLSNDHTCKNESEDDINMLVSDDCLLKEFAPEIYDIAKHFKPSLESLRKILELESTEQSIEEAACEWALKDKSTITSWKKKLVTRRTYQIWIFFCSNDPNFNKFNTMSRYLGGVIKSFYSKNFHINLSEFHANCSKPNDVINEFKSLSFRTNLIGMAVGAVRNKLEVAKALEGLNVPIMFYDVNADDVVAVQENTTTSLWHPTGRSLHQSLALHTFIKDMNWSRVAVISEETTTAKNLFEELKNLGGIFLRNHLIRDDLTISEAEKVLKELDDENARIILVNTDHLIAEVILSAAARLNMNAENRYAWIVREWEPTNTKNNITHYTMSFGYRSDGDVFKMSKLNGIPSQIQILWPVWPLQVTAFIDALFSLVNGFADVINKYPQARYDPQSKEVIRQFERSFTEVPMLGLIQNFTYKNHSLEETFVFLDKWNGNERTLLARWRVSAQPAVYDDRILDKKYYETYTRYTENPPKDGTIKCLLQAGDPYLPTCYDPLWISVTVFALLLVLSVLIIKIFMNRSRKKHKNNTRTPTSNTFARLCGLHESKQHQKSARSPSELEKKSCLLRCSQKNTNDIHLDFDSGFGEEPVPEISPNTRS